MTFIEMIKGFFYNLVMWTGIIVLFSFTLFVLWYIIWSIRSKIKNRKNRYDDIFNNDNSISNEAANKLLKIKYRIAELTNSYLDVNNDDDYISLSSDELNFILKSLNEKAFYYDESLNHLIIDIIYHIYIYTGKKKITIDDITNKVNIVEKMLDIYRDTYNIIYQNTEIEIKRMEELIEKNGYNDIIKISDIVLICNIYRLIVDNSNWKEVVGFNEDSEQLPLKSKLK